jgi:DNA helicase IV
VRQRQRQPGEDRKIDVDGVSITVRRKDILAAQERARRSHKPHNAARSTFVADMVGRLAAQFLELRASRGAVIDHDDAVDAIRGSRDLRVLLNLCWMPLSPYKLLEDLYAKTALLDLVGSDLPERDRRLLAREPGSGWTVSDVPLLDEAAELLGEDEEARRREAALRAQSSVREQAYASEVMASGVGNGMNDADLPWLRVDAETLAGRFARRDEHLSTAEKASRDRRWTFGHIVVDEAQELSPMEWRLLVRRCPTRSMTIVGDVGQTHASTGTRAWRSVLGKLLGKTWRIEELTVNYRTPASVMAAAERTARAAGLEITTTLSARDTDGSLQVVDAQPLGPELVHQAQALLASGFTGRVAVVAAPESTQACLDALMDSSLRDKVAQASQATVLDSPIAVMTPAQTKGLEFDDVILCEPADILTGPSGANDLYVAMTRPTQRLVILHEKPLPDGIPYF